MTTKTKEPKKDAKTEAIEKVKKTLAPDENIIALRQDTIKNYICPKATPQEIAMFLNTCAMFDLNPFKKEIYLIKYGNYAATTVVGYQAYLKRAERSGKWAGIASGIKEGTKGDDLTAWAKAWRTDWKEPAYVEVDYSEYVQKTGNGDPNKFWKEKPKTMLKKVAVSQVLRLAFPDETASLPYTMFETDIEAKAVYRHKESDQYGRVIDLITISAAKLEDDHAAEVRLLNKEDMLPNDSQLIDFNDHEGYFGIVDEKSIGWPGSIIWTQGRWVFDVSVIPKLPPHDLRGTFCPDDPDDSRGHVDKNGFCLEDVEAETILTVARDAAEKFGY